MTDTYATDEPGQDADRIQSSGQQSGGQDGGPDSSESGSRDGGQDAVATDDSAIGATPAGSDDPEPTADQGVAHAEEPLTAKLASVQDSIDTAKESAHQALPDPE